MAYINPSVLSRMYYTLPGITLPHLPDVFVVQDGSNPSTAKNLTAEGVLGLYKHLLIDPSYDVRKHVRLMRSDPLVENLANRSDISASMSSKEFFSKLDQASKKLIENSPYAEIAKGVDPIAELVDGDEVLSPKIGDMTRLVVGSLVQELGKKISDFNQSIVQETNSTKNLTQALDTLLKQPKDSDGSVKLPASFLQLIADNPSLNPVSLPSGGIDGLVSHIGSIKKLHALGVYGVAETASAEKFPVFTKMYLQLQKYAHGTNAHDKQIAQKYLSTPPKIVPDPILPLSLTADQYNNLVSRTQSLLSQITSQSPLLPKHVNDLTEQQDRMYQLWSNIIQALAQMSEQIVRYEP